MLTLLARLAVALPCPQPNSTDHGGVFCPPGSASRYSWDDYVSLTRNANCAASPARCSAVYTVSGTQLCTTVNVTAVSLGNNANYVELQMRGVFGAACDHLAVSGTSLRGLPEGYAVDGVDSCDADELNVKTATVYGGNATGPQVPFPVTVCRAHARLGVRCRFGQVEGPGCLCNHNQSRVASLDAMLYNAATCDPAATGSPSIAALRSAWRKHGIHQTVLGACPAAAPRCAGAGTLYQGVESYGVCQAVLPVVADGGAADGLFQFPVEGSRYVTEENRTSCDCHSQAIRRGTERWSAAPFPNLTLSAGQTLLDKVGNGCELVQSAWVWDRAPGFEDAMLLHMPAGQPVPVQVLNRTGTPCASRPNTTCGVYGREPPDAVALSRYCAAQATVSLADEVLAPGVYDGEVAATLSAARAACLLSDPTHWASTIGLKLRGQDPVGTFWANLTAPASAGAGSWQLAATELFLATALVEAGLGALDPSVAGRFPNGTSPFTLLHAMRSTTLKSVFDEFRAETSARPATQAQTGTQPAVNAPNALFQVALQSPVNTIEEGLPGERFSLGDPTGPLLAYAMPPAPSVIATCTTAGNQYVGIDDGGVVTVDVTNTRVTNAMATVQNATAASCAVQDCTKLNVAPSWPAACAAQIGLVSRVGYAPILEKLADATAALVPFWQHPDWIVAGDHPRGWTMRHELCDLYAYSAALRECSSNALYIVPGGAPATAAAAGTVAQSEWRFPLNASQPGDKRYLWASFPDINATGPMPFAPHLYFGSIQANPTGLCQLTACGTIGTDITSQDLNGTSPSCSTPWPDAYTHDDNSACANAYLYHGPAHVEADDHGDWGKECPGSCDLYVTYTFPHHICWCGRCKPADAVTGYDGGATCREWTPMNPWQTNQYVQAGPGTFAFVNTTYVWEDAATLLHDDSTADGLPAYLASERIEAVSTHIADLLVARTQARRLVTAAQATMPLVFQGSFVEVLDAELGAANGFCAATFDMPVLQSDFWGPPPAELGFAVVADGHVDLADVVGMTLTTVNGTLPSAWVTPTGCAGCVNGRAPASAP